MQRDSHFGGAAGNCSVKLNRTLKYPPAYGVPSEGGSQDAKTQFELGRTRSDASKFGHLPASNEFQGDRRTETTLTRPLDHSSNVQHVFLIRLDTNSLRRVLPEFVEFAHESLQGWTGWRLQFQVETRREVMVDGSSVVSGRRSWNK